MPQTCMVIGCGNRFGRDRVSFFCVPAARQFEHAENTNKLSATRRQRWIDAIGRDDLIENILKNERVCSNHFIAGKPAALKDLNNPDWVPTLNMGYWTYTVIQDTVNNVFLRCPLSLWGK